MKIDIPRELKDSRPPDAIEEDRKRADRYADQGSVMHFAMRLGFFPNDEEEAESIIHRIIIEQEYLETWILLHYCGDKIKNNGEMLS